MGSNDIVVWFDGSVCLVHAVSGLGEAWLSETAPEDAQWLGRRMAVETRHILRFISAAREAGLAVLA